MAQVDTGLGWSANEDWLIQSGGLIGKIGSIKWNDSTGYGDQHVPVIGASGADLRNNGLLAVEYANTGHNIYIGAASDGILAYAPNAQYGQMRVIFISAEPNAKVYYGTDTGGSGITEILTSNVSTYQGNTYYWAATSRYLSWGTPTAYHVPKIGWPESNPDSQVFSQIERSETPIYQLNPGYAVTCIVNWRDFAPATYWTPFLISTNEEYAKLSLDGTTEYSGVAKSIKMYDGLRFFISYIRGINGSPNTLFPTFDANAEFIGPGADSLSLNNVLDMIISASYANILVNETVDPYAPFGNTEEGGGEVNPDPEDDDIEEPNLPGLSFAATGLCRIYRADLIALNQLANYMWTDNTFLQTLVNHAIQLIENPMDAIISLCLVPVAPPAFSVGTAEAVSVMYIPTPAAMWPVINQFARVDCGTLDLEETYGSALDYNPYTKVSCFLPYIGFVDLDTDEVMGKTLNVVYRIDVVTGVCVAMIKVNGEAMYQFSGHCAIQMPLSSADFSTVISSLLQAGKLVAGAALTAAGAPEVGGMLLDAPQVSQPSTTVRKMVGTERNPNTGRQITTGTVTETIEKTGKPLALGELAKRQSANTVGAIMNSKFGIEHSGGFSGNSGYLGVRRPFIIVKRPRLANPEQYGQYNGRPSMIYLNLGTCTGYTEVQSIQLTGIAATNSELSEIATLLKTGVIL